MLFDILQGNNVWMSLITALLTIPTVLIALSVHEAAHAYIAHKCGDPTARSLGRLTLNPAKHLDLVGTICMFVCGFGWAKPVPINSRYFKNPKRGMALTALAGPVSNLILGFIGAVAATLIGRLPYSNITLAAYLFFFYFMMINISYAVFNMLPIPPFDGSRVFYVIMPDKLYWKVMQYERIIMIVVLVLMATGVLWTPVEYLSNLIMRGMTSLVNLIF